MSRSRRHTLIFGITTSRSEKDDKRQANRRLRRRVRVELRVKQWERLPLLRELSNVWSFDKDGKRFWREATPADMRK